MKNWLFCLLFFIPITAHSSIFPEVIASSAKFDVEITDTPQFISYPIKNQTGKAEYWLICFAGNDTGLDKLSDETGINFVAPFACRLSEDAERLSEKTLLSVPDEGAYWHTRALFLLDELKEPCGSYPEYGRVRHFELREFRLTLSITDIVDNKNKMGFTLNVEVLPDNESKSPWAIPVETPSPKWINGKCALP